MKSWSNLSRNFFIFHSLLWIFVLLHGIGVSKQETLLEDLTLSHNQKLHLDQFKSLVSSFLPHAYMKEDSYLVRWLRAKDFNLEEAKEMLYKNIKWRKANDMDSILKEDWSSFEKEYRYNLEGCDVEGRPVKTIFLGDWDLRKATITGQSKKLMRYFDKFLEEINVFIQIAQRQGQNVTRYVEIYDMSHFSMQKQGCPLCIPIFSYLFQTYDDHFPGTAHKTILIKTPAVFQSLWKILSSSLSKETKDLLTVYGRDKSEWQNGLFKSITKDQLTWELGGNKEFPIDIAELRNTPNTTFQCSLLK